MTLYRPCIASILRSVLICVAVFTLDTIASSSDPALSNGKYVDINVKSQVYEQTVDISGEPWVISVRKGAITRGIATGPSKISFAKIINNKTRLVSEDMVEDHFLSTTILRDNANFIYTIWIGTHYWVRVYLLDGDNAKKVLEIGSYSPLSFITLKSGKQGLLIDTNNNQISKQPYSYDVYVFDGKSYQLFRNVSLNAVLTVDEQKSEGGNP